MSCEIQPAPQVLGRLLGQQCNGRICLHSWEVWGFELWNIIIMTIWRTGKLCAFKTCKIRLLWDSSVSPKPGFLDKSLARTKLDVSQGYLMRTIISEMVNYTMIQQNCNIVTSPCDGNRLVNLVSALGLIIWNICASCWFWPKDMVSNSEQVSKTNLQSIPSHPQLLLYSSSIGS